MSKQGRALVAMGVGDRVQQKPVFLSDNDLGCEPGTDTSVPTEAEKIEHCGKYTCVKCPLLNTCDIAAALKNIFGPAENYAKRKSY